MTGTVTWLPCRKACSGAPRGKAAAVRMRVVRVRSSCRAQTSEIAMLLTSRSWAAALVVITAVQPPRVDETRRVGGTGGRRTVTMDCGTSAFVVGITAKGGRDGPFGFNLLRRV